MLKRGQVSVFLVVGIVILLLSALFFFIFGQLTKAPLVVEAEQAVETLGPRGAVLAYVEDCMQKTLEPSVYLLALQGGVLYPEQDRKLLLTDYGIINYAWLNGAEGISQEKMEDDLAAYLEEYLPSCLGNFEAFEKENILVEPDYTETKASISIKDTIIQMNLKLPLEVSLADGDTFDAEKFSASLQSNLGTILTAVQGLPFPAVNPSNLVELPYQSTIFPFDETVTIYSLSEESKEAPLAFMFAVRNDYPENRPPQLHHIADKTFKVGDYWQETLTAEDSTNDLLQFSSDSGLFPIQKDGTIDLPITQAGKFEVTFKVKDHQGEEDSQKITITIVQNEE